MVQSSIQLRLKTAVLTCLLWLLHTVVVCQEHCSQRFGGLIQWLEDIVRKLTGRKLGAKRSKGKQPAFPTTVAIVIAEDWHGPVTLDGLAILIHWSSAAGIKRLQIYEQSGHIKTCAESLEGRLNFQSNKAFSLLVCQSPSQLTDSPPLHTKASGSYYSANESTQQQSVAVTLLSEEDGCLPLAAAILAGSKSRHPNVQCNPAAASQGLLDQISAVAGPEFVQQPELVWIFGPVLTLAGFPAWMVRHSEIHGMGLLKDVTKQGIDAALQRYCQTAQRFGR